MAKSGNRARPRTHAELAKRLGVSERSIGTYASRGLPRRKDGSFDMQVVSRWLAENINTRNGSHNQSAEERRARAEYIQARAKRELLKLGVESGRLVDVEEPARLYGRSCATANAHLLELPDIVMSVIPKKKLTADDRRALRKALEQKVGELQLKLQAALSNDDQQ